MVDNYLLSLLSEKWHGLLQMVPMAGQVGAWCRRQGESRSWVRGCPSARAGVGIAVRASREVWH